jgi:3-oxoadipate enol-lactonase
MNMLVHGHNLHVVDTGVAQGLPIVFVHGFPMSHEMWLPQIQACSSLYRVIAYDVMGHGSSDIGEGQYSIEAHVDDLFGLLDQLKITRAVIVGLSMGGYITLRALEREPGRVLAAVLCDTRSETDTNEGKIKRFASMAAVKKNGSATFADGFVKAIFTPASLAQPIDAVQQIRKVISHTPPLSIAGTLLALASRTDTTESLGRINVPVLILVGEKDALTPPAASQDMHRRIPGSTLSIIPGAAHVSNLENEAEFNKQLMAFLAKVRP